MIRFAGLPFVFMSGGGRRTGGAKLGGIRFVRITCFSQIQMPFFIRKAADQIVKVRLIRFVLFAFHVSRNSL